MAVVDPVAMNRASALLVRLAAVAAVVLAATGVPLLFLYQPGGWWSWLSTLHGLASMLFLGSAAGLLLAALAAAWARDRTWVGWALGAGVFVVAAAGALSGQLIAWEVVHTTDFVIAELPGPQGMFDPLADDVQSVTVGGTEVEPGVLLRWTLVHVLVVTAAGVVVGRLLWRRFHAWEGPPGWGDGDGDGDADGASTGSGDEAGNQTAET